MKKPKLHCYACGKTLGSAFYMVAMANPADRVFVMGECCIARADDPGTWVMKVEKKP